MSETIELTLPFPPSTNHYWKSRSIRGAGIQHYVSAEGKRYRRNVAGYVWAAGIRAPLTGRLKVEILLHCPDRRRRDLDNFGGKALLDALTAAAVWEDDSQIDDLHVMRGVIVPGGQTYVRISQL